MNVAPTLSPSFILTSSPPVHPQGVWESIDPLLFGLTFVGALVLYVVCRCQDIKHISVFTAINHRIDDTSSAAKVIGDMVVTSFIGAILTYYLTAPGTNPQAITAGLSFTGVISIIRKK